MPTGLGYGWLREKVTPPWMRNPKGFGGKKAAPFKKGGGRKTSHPHTAKGLPRRKGSR